MYSMYPIFHGLLVYMAGMVLGFFMIPLCLSQKMKLMPEEEAKRIDEYYNNLFIEYKFIQELEEAPMSSLTIEELAALKNEILYYEIPSLHYKVHMFYDSEKNAFCYFSANELPYKYADVVCRHYVLEHKCKQVYLFPEEAIEEEAKAKEETKGPFVAKKEKRNLLQKELNKFIYLGKYEKPVPVPEFKPLSFLQFKFLKQS
jgi:hypothetical protein